MKKLSWLKYYPENTTRPSFKEVSDIANQYQYMETIFKKFAPVRADGKRLNIGYQADSDMCPEDYILITLQATEKERNEDPVS